jgi:hypothetical protein
MCYDSERSFWFEIESAEVERAILFVRPIMDVELK